MEKFDKQQAYQYFEPLVSDAMIETLHDWGVESYNTMRCLGLDRDVDAVSYILVEEASDDWAFATGLELADPYRPRLNNQKLFLYEQYSHSEVHRFAAGAVDSDTYFDKAVEMLIQNWLRTSEYGDYEYDVLMQAGRGTTLQQALHGAEDVDSAIQVAEEIGLSEMVDEDYKNRG